MWSEQQAAPPSLADFIKARSATQQISGRETGRIRDLGRGFRDSTSPHLEWHRTTTFKWWLVHQCKMNGFSQSQPSFAQATGLQLFGWEGRKLKKPVWTIFSLCVWDRPLTPSEHPMSEWHYQCTSSCTNCHTWPRRNKGVKQYCPAMARKPMLHS